MLSRIRRLLFEHRSTRQVIAKNALWLGAGEFVSRLIRALTVIYAARVLGAAEYGVFSYVLGIAGFFTAFSSVGISTLLLRDIAQNPEKAREYFSVSFFARLALLLPTMLLVILAAPLVSQVGDARLIFIFAALLIAFDGFRDLASAVFRARERMEFEALLTFVTNISIAACVILVLFLFPNPLYLTLGYAAGAGVGALLGIILLWDWFTGIVRYFRKELIAPLLRSASAILLTASLGPLMLHTDIIMLGWWRSASEVGIYAAAQKIIFILIILPDILSISIFPFLSRLAKENSLRLQSIVERSLTILFSLAIPLVFGGVVFARPLLSFIYGEEFSSGTLTFQILLFSLLLLFPRMIVHTLVFARDKQKTIAFATLLGALGNIGFNILLIPRFGASGSAIATLISLFLNRGFIWREAKKIQEFSVLRHLPRMLCAGVLGPGIVGLALSLLGVHVLLAIPISAVAYGLLLILFRDPVIKEFRDAYKRVLL
ncbi:MAG: oligosaccharide flippase family protein [Nanoarchaeota archaeon]|nr:oligosaccharide flippase family protein [Nanoarchaeota archaeon]